MTTAVSVESLSDDALLSRFSDLVKRDNALEAEILAYIGEIDRRRLYVRRACTSMYTYCTEVLHMSESAAGRRIACARAARHYPILLDRVAAGELHTSGLAIIAKLLTDDNVEDVIARAVHKSRDEIKCLRAELVPKPDAPETVRRVREQTRRKAADRQVSDINQPQLPPVGVTSKPIELSSPDARPTPRHRTPAPTDKPIFVLEPLAPARFKVQFTASQQLTDLIKRCRALLRSKIPDGNLEALMQEAFEALREKTEKKKFSKTDKPRSTPTGVDPTPRSRRIPNAVKRRVFERDRGQCAFVDIETGRRCDVTDNVEFHHVVPFARGGDHSVDNVRLLCRAHNALLAERDFGDKARRHRRHGPLFGST